MYLSASKFTGGSVTSTTTTIDSMFSSTNTLTQQASPKTIATPVLPVTDTTITPTPSQPSKQSTKPISSYFTPVREQANSSPPAKKRKLDMSTSTHENLTTPSQITADTASRLQTDFDYDPTKDASYNEDTSIEHQLNSEPNDLNSSYDGLTPELLTVCEVCGRRVPVWEEQEHSDYHLAMKLQRGGVKGRGRRGGGRGTSILDFVVR